MAKHLTKKQREAQIASLYSKKAARKEGSRDLIYSYLIVCEGTKSEPNYLRHFVSRRTKVFGADRSTMKLVEKWTLVKIGQPLVGQFRYGRSAYPTVSIRCVDLTFFLF